MSLSIEIFSIKFFPWTRGMLFWELRWINFHNLPENFQQRSTNYRKHLSSNQFIDSSCFSEHVERIFDNRALHFWKNYQKFSDRCPIKVRKVFQSTIFLTKSPWIRRMQLWLTRFKKNSTESRETFTLCQQIIKKRTFPSHSNFSARCPYGRVECSLENLIHKKS